MSDFDSKTVLDYLGPTASEHDVSLDVPPLEVLSTDSDATDSESPPQVSGGKCLEALHYNECQTNCYNASVESGVVLDLPSHDTVRKISSGSADGCSRGSSHDHNFQHTYIGMANMYTCTCTECRVQRERLYSKRGQSFSETQRHTSHSSKFATTNEDSKSEDDQLKDNNEQSMCGARTRSGAESPQFTLRS